jgi:TRAP-type uncharacterized transport system substrate-binding protein
MRSIWRWATGLIFLVVVIVAVSLIGPAVPNEIVLLTGHEGTTFFEDGLRYQEFLGRHGVDVRLEQTGGSAENMTRIADAEVPTAAFAWGTVEAVSRMGEVPPGVESLGTVYLQPLWVFARSNLDADQLAKLRGSRIEAGREGTDSRLLAVFLLREEGVGESVIVDDNPLLTIDQVEAAVREDRIEALIAVGGPDSELIDTLLRAPNMRPISIERAEAFSIRYPFLKPARFPEGAHDLGANIPDHDLQLLTARVQLFVSDLFPPALADLLLQAATEIHGAATPFSSRGDFPSSMTGPFPLNRAAADFYLNGPPKLQKYLPFRLATWLDRFAAAGVAVASAAVTLFNILPAVLGLKFRREIKRGYRELQAIERLAAAGTDRDTLLEELGKTDRLTAGITPPLRRLGTQWLELRQYLHDMRDRLEAP